MFQKSKNTKRTFGKNIETVVEEPLYIIGVELEGVNHKINIYDGERAPEAIKKFCRE
jgi:hypothetical protein